MYLREALKQAGISYRPLAKHLGSSRTMVSRLVQFGEYPKGVGETECKRRIADLLEKRDIDVSKIQWPRRGAVTPQGEEPRKARVSDPLTEEIDLMQLDRNVLGLFGLRANPFLNDVETDDDVFRFRGYEMVDTAIREAIEQRGFLAVIADSGSGKTTIWDGIEAEYGSRPDTVICRPLVKSRETLTPEHLARCLIYGLLGDTVTCRANAEDRGRQLSRALLALRQADSDRKAVLVIDDAHFCNASVLRQLKTFYEEKVGRFRLLTILLIGLPALKVKLAEFPEIGNRIRPVDVPPVPVREYLEFKLKRVGSSLDKVFSTDGFEAFCERFRQGRGKAAMGRPLVVNATCIRAMVALHQNGASAGEKITRELVDSMPGQAMARRVA